MTFPAGFEVLLLLGLLLGGAAVLWLIVYSAVRAATSRGAESRDQQ